MLSFKDFVKDVVISESIFQEAKGIGGWEVDDEKCRKYIKIIQSSEEGSQEWNDAFAKLWDEVKNNLKYNAAKYGRYADKGNKNEDQYISNMSMYVLKRAKEFDLDMPIKFIDSLKQASRGLGLNELNIDKREGRGGTTTVSIDDKIAGDHGDFADKDRTVGDTIEDTNVNNDPSYDMLRKDAIAIIRDVIESLPEKEYTAINTYFLEPAENGKGKGRLQDVADKLGMTIPGAKKVLERSYDILKSRLEESGENLQDLFKYLK